MAVQKSEATDDACNTTARRRVKEAVNFMAAERNVVVSWETGGSGGKRTAHYIAALDAGRSGNKIPKRGLDSLLPRDRYGDQRMNRVTGGSTRKYASENR